MRAALWFIANKMKKFKPDLIKFNKNSNNVVIQNGSN